MTLTPSASHSSSACPFLYIVQPLSRSPSSYTARWSQVFTRVLFARMICTTCPNQSLVLRVLLYHTALSYSGLMLLPNPNVPYNSPVFHAGRMCGDASATVCRNCFHHMCTYSYCMYTCFGRCWTPYTGSCIPWRCCRAWGSQLSGPSVGQSAITAVKLMKYCTGKTFHILVYVLSARWCHII